MAHRRLRLVRLLSAALVAVALLVGGLHRMVPERADPDLAAARAFALLVDGAQGICGEPGAPDSEGADCLACVLAGAMVPDLAAGAATPVDPAKPAFTGPERTQAAGRMAWPRPPARGPPDNALDHA
ncbi:MAG: hypothetical protein MUE98_14205 [Rhodobacteraceae bacterium]|jgi:hypothetical protein|nr:hypothetical protein [Paracoccaceae bacterium]